MVDGEHEGARAEGAELRLHDRLGRGVERREHLIEQEHDGALAVAQEDRPAESAP